MLFHLIKLHVEHEQHSWITGLYWTLVVMTTLGFGDITFTSDTGRIFSIVVLLSGIVFLLVMMPFLFIRLFYAPWLEARVRLRAPREVPEGTQGHVIVVESRRHRRRPGGAIGIEAVMSLLRGYPPVLLGEGVELFSVPVPAALAGRMLKDSGIGSATGLSVVALQADGELIVPLTSETRLSRGAELLMLGSHDNVSDSSGCSVDSARPRRHRAGFQANAATRQASGRLCYSTRWPCSLAAGSVRTRS